MANVLSVTPAGQRLTLLRPVGRLGVVIPAMLVVGVVGGLLPAILVLVFVGLSAAVITWGVAIVVIAVPGSILGLFAEGNRIRALEFQAGQVILVAGVRERRSQTLALTAVRRVVVQERLGLGRLASREVVLHTTSAGQVTLNAGEQAMAEVGSEELAGWLREGFRSAGVPVERTQEAQTEFLFPDEWWRPDAVALAWQVPVAEVHTIARERDVPVRAYTPRQSALYSPDKTVKVFHPGRAHEVAMELCAERSGTETS